ncbi:MAG TPA: serine/threonine-protein kinase, partial [Vicinamibacterales bacterium]|nr:serine/threonine-protein kinase [Vicinamibacterales bacterium]
MTPQEWQQLKALWAEALALEPEARAAWLARLRAERGALAAELEAMLRSLEGAADFLERPLVVFPAGDEPLAGHRAGPYRLVRELGTGGMGTVYLGERADETFRRTVAVKLVRGGPAPAWVADRFRQERQILADLDHPNIGRLLDGGTTDEGVPYFVMEYVDGRPIDVYADEEGLGVEARLELFLAVCDAVSHAHAHRVVHRDLKPGNVFVTRAGHVKLLDFGIAKLLDGEGAAIGSTETAARMLTPEYASPEHFRGEPIGPASDIYSLGVLLYRLLAGRGPYRATTGAPLELAREICEREPERPSLAAREAASPACRAFVAHPLARDLDAIVLKALRKRPADRYASVEELAADLRRVLEGGR